MTYAWTARTPALTCQTACAEVGAAEGGIEDYPAWFNGEAGVGIRRSAGNRGSLTGELAE